jgi:hypothetical protein
MDEVGDQVAEGVFGRTWRRREREKSLPFVRSEEHRVDGDCTCVRMGIAGMTTERIKGRKTFEKPRGFQMSVTSGMSRWSGTNGIIRSIVLTLQGAGLSVEPILLLKVDRILPTPDLNEKLLECSIAPIDNQLDNVRSTE